MYMQDRIEVLRRDIDKHGKVKVKKGQQAPPAAKVCTTFTLLFAFSLGKSIGHHPSLSRNPVFVASHTILDMAKVSGVAQACLTVSSCCIMTDSHVLLLMCIASCPPQQHSTARHSTAQHSTSQHSTAQPIVPLLTPNSPHLLPATPSFHCQQEVSQHCVACYRWCMQTYSCQTGSPAGGNES